MFVSMMRDLLQSLRRVKMTDHCNVAKQPENKASNRYRNVLPCEYISTLVYIIATDSNSAVHASDLGKYRPGASQAHRFYRVLVRLDFI